MFDNSKNHFINKDSKFPGGVMLSSQRLHPHFGKQKLEKQMQCIIFEIKCFSNLHFHCLDNLVQCISGKNQIM